MTPALAAIFNAADLGLRALRGFHALRAIVFLLILVMGLFPRQRHSKRLIAPTRSAASATVMLQRTPPYLTTARVDF
jgi:hypothetical protein